MITTKLNESGVHIMLKVVPNKLKVGVTTRTQSNKTTSRKTNTLPTDEYSDMIKQRELPVDENVKLVFSVARKGDYGLPHIDIRTHITSENYTGLTKKGINFDTDYLMDFAEIINTIISELVEMGI